MEPKSLSLRDHKGILERNESSRLLSLAAFCATTFDTVPFEQKEQIWQDRSPWVLCIRHPSVPID